jgi:hypothetical protein
MVVRLQSGRDQRVAREILGLGVCWILRRASETDARASVVYIVRSVCLSAASGPPTWRDFSRLPSRLEATVVGLFHSSGHRGVWTGVPGLAGRVGRGEGMLAHRVPRVRRFGPGKVTRQLDLNQCVIKT